MGLVFKVLTVLTIDSSAVFSCVSVFIALKGHSFKNVFILQQVLLQCGGRKTSSLTSLKRLPVLNYIILYISGSL